MRWLWTILLFTVSALAQNQYGSDYLILHGSTPDANSRLEFGNFPRPGFAPSISPPGSAVLYFDSGCTCLKVSNNGGAYSALGGGGTGTVSANNGSAGAVANYAAAGGSTTVGPDATLVDNGATLTYSGTTGIVAPSGSASAPSLVFSGATTTGFSRATTNIVADIAGVAQVSFNSSSGLTMPSGNWLSWSSTADPTVASDTTFARTSAKNVQLGAGGDATGTFTTSTYAVLLTATAALTAGQVVKIDTANSNAVVVAATTDTGGGIAVGIVANSPGAGASAQVITTGRSATPVLGTGTCSIGQFVIVDTTTAGRVQCTGTFTAGTVIGKAITAQAAVGSAVSVLVGLR